MRLGIWMRKRGEILTGGSWLAAILMILSVMASETFAADCRLATDKLGARLFAEYGAMFFATQDVILPTTCIFTSEDEVRNFQAKLSTTSAKIGNAEIDLQSAAMESLQNAIRQAENRGIRISPLDGEIAGKRSFADTQRIWNSRFLPGLDYWVRRDRLSRTEADAALGLGVLEQVEQVLKWEAKGMFFSTGKNRSIMSSVAPPGTSQHLSLLAFDIEQARNKAVRDIMNANGWFQTVLNDSPHFTYLGVAELELPKRGLKATIRGGYKYWVPAL